MQRRGGQRPPPREQDGHTAALWPPRRAKVISAATRTTTLISHRLALAMLMASLLCGCDELVPLDTKSLFIPTLQRSEIFGCLAGFGTTFAAAPDLIAMLRRRSSAGMHPRMAGIMGVFQIVWVYYGLLIASRPVILWNMIAVLINLLSVAAYAYFARKEQANAEDRGHPSRPRASAGPPALH
jgi:MtN3 and saliva related transmembrane protein